MIKKWLLTGMILFLGTMLFAQEVNTYQEAIENVLEKLAEGN